VLSHQVQQPQNTPQYQLISGIHGTYYVVPTLGSMMLTQSISAPMIMLVPYYTAFGQFEYYPLMMPQIPLIAPYQPFLPYQQPLLPIASPSQQPLLPTPSPSQNMSQPPRDDKKEARKERRQRQRAKKSAKKFATKQQAQMSHAFLHETLSEKIAQSDMVKEYVKSTMIHENGYSGSSITMPIQADPAYINYSQTPMLSKINAFLRYSNCPETTRIGHCNGITLLWLTMMSWGLEPLFYNMVKEIAECPYHQLHRVYKTILSLFDWIDLGQNPSRYSNKKYSQYDIDKIIGNIPGSSYFEKKHTLDKAADAVQKFATENTIVALSGNDIDAHGQRRHIGHAIGLFYRRSEGYCLFDSEYENGKPKKFATAKEAAVEINHRLFHNRLARGESKLEWRLAVAKRPAMPAEISQMKKSA
jgi:hypothetical protein